MKTKHAAAVALWRACFLLLLSVPAALASEDASYVSATEHRLARQKAHRRHRWVSKPRTSSDRPGPYIRRKGVAHDLVLIEDAANLRLPPAKLKEKIKVTNAKTSTDTYVLGKFIASGNFGNVYRLQSHSGKEVPPHTKVIKQMSEHDDTHHEDLLAAAYKVKNPQSIKHLALMETAFQGTAVVTKGTPAQTFKFQVGPDQAGKNGLDLGAYMAKTWDPSRSEDPAIKALATLEPPPESKKWLNWINEVKKVARGLADGLHVLHTCSDKQGCKGGPFMHQDVKGPNTFLTLNDEGHIEHVALGDFGLVMSLASRKDIAEPNRDWIMPDTGSSPYRTKYCSHGSLMCGGGSPNYMAPETLRGYICKPFGSNDMWSLGYLLMEMMLAPANKGQSWMISDTDDSRMDWGPIPAKGPEDVGDEVFPRQFLAERVEEVLRAEGGNLYSWAEHAPVKPKRMETLNNFVNLIRGLTHMDVTKRWTAKRVMESHFVKESGTGARASGGGVRGTGLKSGSATAHGTRQKR